MLLFPHGDRTSSVGIPMKRLKEENDHEEHNNGRQCDHFDSNVAKAKGGAK